MISTVVDAILGDKRANSETRHKPNWWPKHFDKRWFNERVAIMDLPPYEPPFRRYIRLKGWICTDHFCKHMIVEIDLDERNLDVNIYE